MYRSVLSRSLAERCRVGGIRLVIATFWNYRSIRRRQQCHGPSSHGCPIICMSVVADGTVPAESFTLHQALAAEPDVTVETERLASHSVEWVFPFHWASGGDFDRFREAMQEDPTVANVTASRDPVRTSCVRSNGGDEILDLVTEITDQHASILYAKAKGEIAVYENETEITDIPGEEVKRVCTSPLPFAYPEIGRHRHRRIRSRPRYSRTGCERRRVGHLAGFTRPIIPYLCTLRQKFGGPRGPR